MENEQNNIYGKLLALSSEPKLKALENRLKREVNFFDILGVSETEIRHSNMLAWLLDPNQNHGLGSFMLKQLYDEIADNDAVRPDFKKFKVYREWKNIDLLLVSETVKVVICIENKINAVESPDQLEKYHNIIEREYPGYKTYYRFLTLDGHESSQPDVWQSLDYEFIIKALKLALETHEYSLSNRAETIISQYLSILERKVIGMDDKTRELVDDIFKEHREAIEFIMENTSKDVTGLTSKALYAWLEKNLPEEYYIDSTKSIKSFARIHSRTMDKLFPNSDSRLGWGNGSKYYYEISCAQDGTGTMKLVFSLEALETDAEKALVDKMFKEGGAQGRITSKKWRTVKVFANRQPFVDEDYELLPKVAEELEKIFTEEIPEFEKNGGAVLS